METESREHVGQRIDGQPHKIEAAIALRYPNRIATVDDIDEELKKTKDLQYCAVYPKGKRFPTTGWLTGSVCDLADLIHLVDVPETAFQKCADDLIGAIDSINESYFFPVDKTEMSIINKIFKLLGLTENPKDKAESKTKRGKQKRKQAGRMSGAIIANALLFQERIAKHYEDIPPIHQLFCQPGGAQQAALEAWQKILDINYWPIFKTAKDIVYELDAETAGKILERLADEAKKIREKGLLYENDLTGHVFQKLIVDRKYLAAVYGKQNERGGTA